MTPNTVLGHLCKLFEENHPINLNNYDRIRSKSSENGQKTIESKPIN